MSGLYEKMLISCDKALGTKLQKAGCQDCTCPPNGEILCQKQCVKKNNCEDCLNAYFSGDDNQKNKRYNCEPITYTYVIRYLNRYASEIYRIFLQKSDMLQKLNHSLIFSLGCGPATELMAINEIVKEFDIQNCSYKGFEPNTIWDNCHNIATFNKAYSELGFSFSNEKITSQTENLENIMFLIINYVCSDIYVHERCNGFSLEEWFVNELKPIINKMKSNSYIIINDVNSPKMGRNEIQEWSWNLKQSSQFDVEYFTFKKTKPSKYYNEPYELKFDPICNSTSLNEKDFIFPATYSIINNKHAVFSKELKSCQSCFVIIHKK